MSDSPGGLQSISPAARPRGRAVLVTVPASFAIIYRGPSRVASCRENGGTVRRFSRLRPTAGQGSSRQDDAEPRAIVLPRRREDVVGQLAGRAGQDGPGLVVERP